MNPSNPLQFSNTRMINLFSGNITAIMYGKMNAASDWRSWVSFQMMTFTSIPVSSGKKSGNEMYTMIEEVNRNYEI